MISKKNKLLIFLCVIGIVMIIIVPKNTSEITNALVNPDNGDIAFSYYDFSGRGDFLIVSVFNKNGEELFSKRYLNSYSPEMVFKDNNLYICLGRTDKLYSYDREGNPINNTLLPNEIKESTPFHEWNGFLRMTYSFDGNEYCYEQPTIFNRSAKLTVSNDGKTVIIYESP